MTEPTGDFIEEIRDRNPIEDIIEADGYPLSKRGLYWKCTTHGTGGLVVSPSRGLYYWNVQDEHGDVFTWVEHRQRVDFKGAAEWLARRANLPEPNWRHEDAAARMAARAREDALEVAQRVFVRWLGRTPAALDYCTGRGWTQSGLDDEDGSPTPGTITLAMLGFSGDGSASDFQEMRGELGLANVDLESRAAVAILGKRGGLSSWATNHGVELEDDWVLNDRIPAMVGGRRLVYPHVRGGRIRYLSARSIEGKYHYNLPRCLVGDRQPLFNQVYSSKADLAVVVEGQADALSLGQLGIPAVALAGVKPGEDLADLLRGHKGVYVALDADKAGTANAWKVADALGPMARVFSWRCPSRATFSAGDEVREVKDANDLLRAMIQAGDTPETQSATVRGLVEPAATYVEQIAAWAGCQEGQARDDALPQALKVISRMEKFQLEQYRKSLAKLLRVDQRELVNLLKTMAAAEKEERAGGEPVFTWGELVDGWLIEYLYDVETDQAGLAWRDPQGKVGSGKSVTIGGRDYEPYPPNEALRSGAVQFPSALGERKSIRELVAYIEFYLKWIYILPSDQMAKLIAYWVLTTYVYDCFGTVIYLRAMGGAGSGKSELIDRIGLIAYRTMRANGAGSTSALFRSVERYKCTVLIDEADLVQSDTENDMVKFYNLGAMKGNPIWRTVEVTNANGEKDWEAVSFQTFCPKLIAMRKDFKDDAVGSRSLTIKLVSKLMPELMAAHIPLTITNEIRKRAQILRNLLARWRMETWQPEIEIDPAFYDMTISPRLNQVAGPILAMAHDDPLQQEDIRATLREYYAETIITQSMTLDARVIEAIWKIWNYPDLHKTMVHSETDGERTVELIKVGDITHIANEIINQMNDEEETEEDAKFPTKGLKSQRVGRILRNDLQLQITTRRKDGFFVYWNEPRIVGLSMKYGINPADFGPQAKAQPNMTELLKDG